MAVIYMCVATLFLCVRLEIKKKLLSFHMMGCISLNQDTVYFFVFVCGDRTIYITSCEHVEFTGTGGSPDISILSWFFLNQ
jgi:hypothetical protein